MPEEPIKTPSAKLTSGTTAFTTTTTLNSQTSTISLYTADKYLDKDITITMSVKQGYLTIDPQTPTLKQTTAFSVSNIVLAPGKRTGAVITTPIYTCNIPGVNYQVDEGWLDYTEAMTTGTATLTAGGIPLGVQQVTLVNNDTIRLVDGNGTWTWKADSNGNTYIY